MPKSLFITILIATLNFTGCSLKSYVTNMFGSTEEVEDANRSSNQPKQESMKMEEIKYYDTIIINENQEIIQ